MAGLWEVVKESARAAVFGPPASPMLAPQPRVERRMLGVGTGIPNHAFTTSDYIRAGGLIHGPGATEALRRAWELGVDFNPVASICLFRVMTDLPQAPLRVYKSLGGNKRDVVEGHALSSLLLRPNPYMTRTLLWQHTAYSLNAHGNAYWRKIRAGNKDTGNVIQLWPLSPDRCAPVREKGSANFIDYYCHKTGPRKEDEEHIPPWNIVHLRFGIDDRNHMLGISRLRRVLREVATDDEAAEFVNRLLRNNAVMGLVVLTTPDMAMNEEGAMSVKERIADTFTGAGQGSTAVMSGAVRDVKQLGLDPKQLDIGPMVGRAEALICGVIGVPAQVAGIPIGLEHSTYSNFEQAYESYTELTLLPQYPEIAETLDTQLLPDFSADPRESTAFDVDQLRALQEDMDATSVRVVAQWEADLITRDQALSALGKDPLGGAEGEMYFSQIARGGAGLALPAPATATEGRALGLVERRAG